MQRMIYRAQCLEGREEAAAAHLRERIPELQQRVARGELMTISAYRWFTNLFLYCEFITDEIHPSRLFGDMAATLEPWPGAAAKRPWIPMVNVFHFNRPASVEHWRRKQPVEKRIGKVARLRPEMISSYAYFHFLVQEEQAFPGSKYQFIGLHETLMFLYDELPLLKEPPPHPKGLATSITPANWADARMDLHFVPWDDGIKFFREIEPVFGI
jgi:hypothetical protein